MVFVARVTFQNFRCFAEASLTFTEVRTLIAGRNATGKSTIADAIAWCLTGRCRGLDGAGRGVAGLIRTGTSTMRVVVDLLTDDGPLVVVREADAQTRATTLAFGPSLLDLRRGGVAEIQAAIDDRLGTCAAVVATACDATAFFGLDHADAKDLLLRLLDVRVPVDGHALPLDALDAAHRTAELERAAAKKALAALGTKTPPPIPLQPPAAQLRATLDALTVNAAQARDEQAEARGQLVQLERRQRELTAGLANLRAQDRLVPASFATSLGVAERVLAHAEAQLADLRTQEPAAPVTQRVAPEWASRVAAHDPKDGCVFSASIPCKTAASHFRAYVERVRADVDAQQAHATAVRSWRDLLAQQEQETEKVRREVATKRARLAQSEDIATAITAGEEKLEAVTREIEAVRAGLVDVAEASEPSSREARAAVEQQLAVWAQYDQAHAAYQAHGARAAALKAEIATLEARCQTMGPRGARVQALRAALDGFLRGVNAIASRWAFRFDITPDPWAVTVNGRDVALLSASERLRVGVALQLAIVQAAGFGVAFIDAIDVLDKGNNRELSGVVLHPEAANQIVLAATREDDAPVPVVEGLQVVRLAVGADGASTLQDLAEAPAEVEHA